MNNNQENKFDVIVIGGGPSGMMVAGRAGERGLRVLLLEKNKQLGDKLKITGGGRCNITNAEPDKEKFLSHYGKSKDFLYSAFSQYGVKDTFSFFESRGLPLVVEARERAFPKTQKAEDVFKVLEKYLKKNRVTVKTGVRVSRLKASGGIIQSVVADRKTYEAKAVVLATGGLSHPETGATGDGFSWLADLGHTVKSPTPDIVPLSVKEKWVKDLSGVSLSFMKITFFTCPERSRRVSPKKAFSKTGKILFTHFGLSGPLIMNSARAVKDLLRAGVVTAQIDLYPDTELGALDKSLLKIFDQNKNRDLKNIIKDFTPDGLDKAVAGLLKNIDLNKKVHSFTVPERKQITQLLKALPLTITGLLGFDRAVVSDGGVVLTEMDMRTMRSKLYDNLYITGDLLNINRPSGGYSLQLCWTTGFVAGDNVLK
ncbi:MAG TPA: NAD(P)/FAD-dependent oxidoreductase [Candidatus Paceibacterota bacterium]|nr:NAD(P)/FAD-dependent oxidoreductase [Candidatus Paceibacterota bacterium]